VIAAGRDADATRGRILDAAAAEFAELGIAGARIDRIAENAQANKAMIYRYFGNKDDLFDAVFTARVAAFVDAVRFDADDLPGYAGRLFDSYEDQPFTLRLTYWYQLERPDGAPLQVIAAANENKLSGIADAQARGRVPGDFTPIEVLALVRSISLAWNNLTPELGKYVAEDRVSRRAAVVAAAQRLFTPPPTKAEPA
jgi:AcrR family transcriptional regulator